MVNINDFVKNYIVKPGILGLALVTSTAPIQAGERPSQKQVSPEFEILKACQTVKTHKGYGISGLQVADIDGDGKLDIIVSTHDGDVYICRNVGDYIPSPPQKKK